METRREKSPALLRSPACEYEGAPPAHSVAVGSPLKTQEWAEETEFRPLEAAIHHCDRRHTLMLFHQVSIFHAWR